MNKLLIDEPPLQVLPGLAEAIGLNEAILIQQVHYWLKNKNSGVQKNGKNWIYNSISEWEEQFPFWSRSTIRRTIKSAEEKGILIAKQLEKDKGNMVYFYRIDHSEIPENPHEQTPEQMGGQNEQMGGVQNEQMGVSNMNNSAPAHNTSERSETSTEISTQKDKDTSVREIFDYWVDKENTISHRSFTEAFKKSIRARLNDGWSEDEVKEAIDNYDTVVGSDDYFFTYDNWTLKEFLSREEGAQAEKFLTNPEGFRKEDDEFSQNGTGKDEDDGPSYRNASDIISEWKGEDDE